MLSSNQMVAVRQAIEKTYTHMCDVIVKKEYTRSNHSTGFNEIQIITDQACRISFSSISDTEANTAAAKPIQVIKLFIAPEIEIPPGSKIVVKHDNLENAFSKSGQPATYPTHQEIILDYWKGWA